jgi:hypothetical protein
MNGPASVEKLRHRVLHLRQAAGADIDDPVERQVAILRGIEPEHRVVAQADIVEPDRQAPSASSA